MVVCLLKHLKTKVEWFGGVFLTGDCEDQYHSLIELFKVLLLKMSGRPVGWFGGVL